MKGENEGPKLMNGDSNSFRDGATFQRTKEQKFLFLLTRSAH